jgi:7-cyano-7-deazaguanine synthase in queuosine biosynthesis
MNMLHLTKDPLLRKIIGESLKAKENPTVIKFVKPSNSWAIPVSGGLDSTLAYFLANKPGLIPIYVNHGQPYAERELKVLRNLSIKHVWEKIKLPEVEGDWKHIFPLRNFYIFKVAAAYTNTGIIFAALDGEIPRKGGDKSQRFLSLCRQYFNLKIETPFAKCGKSDIIKLLKKDTRYKDRYREIVSQTYSCFKGEEIHCGECRACLRKFIACKQNDIDLEFQKNPLDNKEMIERYKEVMLKALQEKDYSLYSKRRCLEYKNFFKW